MGRVGSMAAVARPWFAVLLAIAAVLFITAVLEEDAVAMLNGDTGDKRFNPAIEPHRLHEVEAINNFQTMTKYIKKRMSEVTKEQLARTDGGADEGIEIGNTLKQMEAKRAVEAELNSEVKVDCEVAAWGQFAKRNKLCDGGKQIRKRAVTTQPKNGGKPCPVLENSIDCNTESCASEAYQRRATRRKLTKEERRRERAINNQKMREAMRSQSTKMMMKKTREVMRKMVHTAIATVKLPGETGPRSPESLVRKDLKVAIAKNQVDSAMQQYESSKKGGPTRGSK